MPKTVRMPKIGDLLFVQEDENSKERVPARLLQVEGSGRTAEFRVHFIGWRAVWDCWVQTWQIAGTSPADMKKCAEMVCAIIAQIRACRQRPRFCPQDWVSIQGKKGKIVDKCFRVDPFRNSRPIDLMYFIEFVQTKDEVFDEWYSASKIEKRINCPEKRRGMRAAAFNRGEPDKIQVEDMEDLTELEQLVTSFLPAGRTQSSTARTDVVEQPDSTRQTGVLMLKRPREKDKAGNYGTLNGSRAGKSDQTTKKQKQNSDDYQKVSSSSSKASSDSSSEEHKAYEKAKKPKQNPVASSAACSSSTVKQALSTERSNNSSKTSKIGAIAKHVPHTAKVSEKRSLHKPQRDKDRKSKKAVTRKAIVTDIFDQDSTSQVTGGINSVVNLMAERGRSDPPMKPFSLKSRLGTIDSLKKRPSNVQSSSTRATAQSSEVVSQSSRTDNQCPAIQPAPKHSTAEGMNRTGSLARVWEIASVEDISRSTDRVRHNARSEDYSAGSVRESNSGDPQEASDTIKQKIGTNNVSSSGVEQGSYCEISDDGIGDDEIFQPAAAVTAEHQTTMAVSSPSAQTDVASIFPKTGTNTGNSFADGVSQVPTSSFACRGQQTSTANIAPATKGDTSAASNVPSTAVVNVRVRWSTDSGGIKEEKCKITVIQPLKKVMDFFISRRKNTGFVSWRFLFDGERLEGHQTPTDLEMIDGDLIDAAPQIDAAPESRPRLTLDYVSRDRTFSLVADMDVHIDSTEASMPIPPKLTIAEIGMVPQVSANTQGLPVALLQLADAKAGDKSRHLRDRLDRLIKRLFRPTSTRPANVAFMPSSWLYKNHSSWQQHEIPHKSHFYLVPDYYNPAHEVRRMYLYFDEHGRRYEGAAELTTELLQRCTHG
eukprot:SAG31_NODE_2072_length_6514_cov_19.807171_3_plen_879_part_00